jgi:hypothetical protein
MKFLVDNDIVGDYGLAHRITAGLGVWMMGCRRNGRVMGGDAVLAVNMVEVSINAKQ